MIFTSLSPNTETKDILKALVLILQPWRWLKGDRSSDVEQFFCSLLPSKNAFAVDSGRTAIMTAVQALGLDESDEVLLQAFTCVAVPNSIRWAKAKPVYVDIDPLTYNIDLSKAEIAVNEKTKVLVIQHTLGNPAPMDEVLDFCRRHNLFLIEDCAHALGAKYKGRNVGSYGDVAIFSFGRDKVVSSVFGGLMATDDADIAKRIKEIVDAYKLPSRFWVLRQLLHPPVLALAKVAYSIQLGKIILEAAKRLGVIAKAVYAEERAGERPYFIGHLFANAMAELALMQLSKLDKFLKHRKTIASLYDNNLKDLYINQITTTNAEPGFLRYNIRVSGSGDAFRLKAKARHILLGDWYNTPVAPSGTDFKKIGYDSGSCPQAEKLAKEIVNLPTHIQIDEKDALKIVKFCQDNYESR